DAVARGAADVDAQAAIECDDVTLAGEEPANGVVGADENVNAVVGVTQGTDSIRGGADQVALDDIGIRGGTHRSTRRDGDAIAVPRNLVADDVDSASVGDFDARLIAEVQG